MVVVGVGGNRGQPAPGERCARAAGTGGRPRLGAQALRCTRSGRAEAAPRCGPPVERGEGGEEGPSGRSRGLGARPRERPSGARSSSHLPCISLTLFHPEPLSSGCLRRAQAPSQLCFGPRLGPGSPPSRGRVGGGSLGLEGRARERARQPPGTWEGRS